MAGVSANGRVRRHKPLNKMGGKFAVAAVEPKTVPPYEVDRMVAVLHENFKGKWPLREVATFLALYLADVVNTDPNRLQLLEETIETLTLWGRPEGWGRDYRDP